MLKYILPALFFLSTVTFAQQKIEFVSFDNVSKEVKENLKNENYKGAIQAISKISKNDSTYCSVLSSKSYYQLQIENYDAVIEAADEGIALGCHEVQEVFYINKLAAMLSQENFDDALPVAEKALEKYPMNASLWFNKAYALEQLERDKEAVAAYQECIVRNPFKASPHVKLGNLYYEQNKKAQALMAFNMYLLLQPDISASFPVLKQLNNVAVHPSNTDKPETELTVDDKSFDDINLILNQKVALSSEYDVGNRVDIALVKQNHALLTKLKEFKGKGGFWSEKYVPFYQWISEQDLFDDFSYTIAFSIENESIQRIVQRKDKEVEAFLIAALTKWADILKDNNGGMYEYDGEYVRASGTINGDVPVGRWLFYWESGQQFLSGGFNDKGERDGTWTWNYENGNTKEVAIYSNDKKEGDYTYYHENGKLSAKTSYSKDELSESYTAYNDSGALTHEMSYKNDKLDGDFLSYFTVGKPLIEYDTKYKNGEVVGDVLEYHLNGQVYAKSTYKDGQKNGPETKFYSNGEKSNDLNYKDNQLHGNYKSYHKNGKVKDEGAYVNGKADGWWKSYYMDGTLESESLYDEGEVEGISKFYSREGKIHTEYEYKRGNIVAYKFYKKDGSVLKEDRKRGGKFNYVSYSPHGIKLIEGVYDVDGGKTGLWKYYNDNGVLESKGDYDNNNINGVYTSYFSNGEIATSSTYKNDNLDGYYVAYHANGKMRVQGWYVEGKEQGDWEYYYEDGKMSFQAFYHNGLYHGEQINYAVDGTKERISTYQYGDLIKEVLYNENGDETQSLQFVNDNETYKITYVYPNGKLWDEFSYKNGFKHGPYVSKNYEGTTTMEGSFVQGYQHGAWKYYDDEGKLESERMFSLNQLEGPYRRYHDNGKIHVKTTYQDDEMHGLYESFHDNGTLMTKEHRFKGEKHGRKENFGESGNLQLIRYYDHGRLMGYSYLNADGEEVPTIAINNETAKVLAYYKNGKVSREFEMDLGEFEGMYKTYHFNGQLQNETPYKDGKIHGLDVYYYDDGTKKIERSFSNGDYHGFQKEYYPNGNVKEELNYVHDSKHGDALYYDENGTLVKKVTYRNGSIVDSKTL